ncbi:DcaP family trimeric outer membrane transporter [Geofilum sp. OHC36d9]|uniref:DcaP family trimeric outer membrane transporter n=1 Tax=Geofilum sp. OHC36d9 TaxID=3458413 RepID=UPI00403420CB
MRLTALLMLGWGVASQLSAQETKLDINIHGFIEVDAAQNSRASNAVRNGHIFLYPLAENLDKNGNDQNDSGDFDLDAGRSRVNLTITGPVINQLTIMGYLEADFLGKAPNYDNNLRLRHAYIKLDYNNLTFTIGQTWHPLFIPAYCPKTVNANVGSPMHPLNRNPQIRINYKINRGFDIMLALVEQNNFRSTGFTNGNDDAGMPEIDLQLQLGGSGNVQAAFTAGYKRLAIPQTDEATWSNQPTVEGFHYEANVLFKQNKYNISAGALYGDNLTEHVMPGGIGLVAGSDATNPEYDPMRIATCWIDINSNSKKWIPGFFAGYLNNRGASKEITVEPYFSRNPEVKDVLSISPRIRYHLTPQASLNLEYLYSQAGWGHGTYDANGIPQNVKNYVNHRTLLAVRYTF